jgi:Holliday junction resolvase RusA-like endonuclease
MIIHKPAFRVWVQGKPMSWRKARKTLSRYTERIAEAARAVVPFPVKSSRIDLEIWFCAPSMDRADLDNIAKPVLDALVGVVYFDDRQVRSLRVVALPTDQAHGISGWGEVEPLTRLAKADPAEFLINIFHGLHIPRGGP